MNPFARPQVFVTLVHGTYAQGAEWVRSGPLCTKLAAKGVKTLPFDWTGENSIEDRHLARVALTEHLRTVNAFCPEAKQIIVAHSHGGNIALQAANAIGRNSNLVGVVTLATPFFQARARSISEDTSRTIQNAVSGLLGVVIFCVAFVAPIPWWLRLCSPIAGITVGALIGGYLAGAMKAMAATAQILADSFRPRFSGSIDLLIVRIVGDEASMALATAQFLTWMSARLYSKMGSAQAKTVRESLRHAFQARRAPRLFWLLFSVVAGFLILLDTAFSYGGTTHEHLIWIWKFTGLALALLLLKAHTTWADGALLGVALLLVGTAKFLQAIWLGTYFKDPEARGGLVVRAFAAFTLALMLDVNTEATPNGKWALIQLEQDTLARDEATERLVHSAYEDPRVQDLVVEYVGGYV